MTDRDSGDGWEKYQKLVLADLRRAHEERAALTERVSDLKLEITALKVKASTWGAVTGAIISAIIAIVGAYLS